MPIKLKLYVKEVLNEQKLSEISDAFLDRMDDIKDVQTQNGRSPAKGGRWNNSYSPEYAKKKGRSRPVNLRSNRGSNSIERTRIMDSGGGSRKLVFTDGGSGNLTKGQIFKLHDTGTARGGKKRQIYPRDESQIPRGPIVAAQAKLNDILSRNG